MVHENEMLQIIRVNGEMRVEIASKMQFFFTKLRPKMQFFFTNLKLIFDFH